MIEVLIAEDDAAALEMLKKTVEFRGFTAHAAKDGIEAAELFMREKDITVVLSDYFMGGDDRNADALHTKIEEELKQRKGLFVLASALVTNEVKMKFELKGVLVLDKEKLRRGFPENIGIKPPLKVT